MPIRIPRLWAGPENGCPQKRKERSQVTSMKMTLFPF